MVVNVGFSHVGEGNDVARVGRCRRLIGYPHFNAVDLHTAHDVGQVAHVVIIAVAEVVGKEEVAILIVVVDVNFKVGELHTALRIDGGGRRLLLGNYRLEFQLTKLQIGTHPKKGGGAADEGGVGGEADVTRFNEFDNFVLLTFVAQLQILGVKGECRIGVVVEVHVHLVAHLTVEVKVDFLVEVKSKHLAILFRKRGIINVAHIGANLQFGRTICGNAYATRTKYFLQGTEIKLHVGEVKLLAPLFFVKFFVFVLIKFA